MIFMIEYHLFSKNNSVHAIRICEYTNTSKHERVWGVGQACTWAARQHVLAKTGRSCDGACVYTYTGENQKGAPPTKTSSRMFFIIWVSSNRLSIAGTVDGAGIVAACPATCVCALGANEEGPCDELNQ